MSADDKPLVSIVVPSFNQGRFIGDTLRSIIGQDYPNLEIIVMDGGSTDETLDVVRSFGDRVQLISEADDGQTDAINKGFGKARGEIVAWLNSDDIYLFKDGVSNAVEQFGKFPSVDVLFGDYIRIDENGRFLKAYRVWRDFSKSRLLRICYISQPTVFFRAHAVRGGVLDVSLYYGMDLDLWLKLGQSGLKYRHTGKFVAAERIHGDAKTVASPEGMVDEATIIRQRYVEGETFRLSTRNLSDKIGLAAFRVISLADALSLYFRRSTVVALKFQSAIKVIAGQLSRA